MKVLETARKTVQKAAAAVVGAIASGPRISNEGYSEDARKAEINARGLHRWLGPRRKGWLR